MTIATRHEVAAAAGAERWAVLHRMVMPSHTCPYGLKALDLLRRRGFAVDDRQLTTREATDAFKAEHGVNTTPDLYRRHADPRL